MTLVHFPHHEPSVLAFFSIHLPINKYKGVDRKIYINLNWSYDSKHETMLNFIQNNTTYNNQNHIFKKLKSLPVPIALSWIWLLFLHNFWTQTILPRHSCQLLWIFWTRKISLKFLPYLINGLPRFAMIKKLKFFCGTKKGRYWQLCLDKGENHDMISCDIMKHHTKQKK